jgi:hypothetical protein
MDVGAAPGGKRIGNFFGVVGEKERREAWDAPGGGAVE